MAASPMFRLLEWLASRAGASVGADAGGRPWEAPSTADRAGRLIPAPQDGLEPEVGRWFSAWALWLAVGLIVLILLAGYVRRRWRGAGEESTGWLTWRWRR